MERLTIDEVIEHCNKTCDMSEYKEIEEVKVDNITIGKPYWQINYDEHEFLPEDFGKSIFLTKEAAEQALAEKKGV